MLLALLFTVHVLGSVCTSMQAPTDVTHGACHCFRRAYLRMSASFEAFFTLRSNFAMVGIDLSYAFGSASQALRVCV